MIKLESTKPRYVVVLVISLAVLMLTSGLIWMRRSLSFPILPVGSYIAQLIPRDETQPKATVSIHQLSSGKRVVNLFTDGFEPVVSLADGVAPLLVPGVDGMKAQLRGSVSGPQTAAGVFEFNNAEGARIRSGRWELTSFTPREAPLNDEEKKELLLWLSLASEIRTQKAKAQAVEKRISDRQLEMDRIAGFISDRTKLKASADQKYKQVAERLAAAQSELDARKVRAKDLESRVILSQRVTPMGKVVTLARETNERELRWVQSMLGGSIDSEQGGIESDVELGEEILTLRSQIATERKKLELIKNGELSTEGGTSGE